MREILLTGQKWLGMHIVGHLQEAGEWEMQADMDQHLRDSISHRPEILCGPMLSSLFTLQNSLCQEDAANKACGWSEEEEALLLWAGSRGRKAKLERQDTLC